MRLTRTSIVTLAGAVCLAPEAVAAPPVGGATVDCVPDDGAGFPPSIESDAEVRPKREDARMGSLTDTSQDGSSVRSGSVAATSTWPNGYIPYEFAITPYPGCRRSTSSFCEGEVDFFTDLEIVDGEPGDPNEAPLSRIGRSGVWWRFLKAAERVVPVKLVDISVLTAAQKPASPLTVRPSTNKLEDWVGGIPDEFPACDPLLNTVAGRVEIEVRSAEAGTWGLGLDYAGQGGIVELNVTTDDAAVAAKQIYEQLIDPSLFVRTADWRIGLLTDRVVMELRDGATALSAGWALALPSGTDAVVRAFEECITNCENPDCPTELQFRCSPVWDEELADYTREEGMCEPSGGRASLGVSAPGGSQNLRLPRHWFTRNLTSAFGHELGHVMGFIHEHQRADFESVRTVIDEDCLVADAGAITSSDGRGVLLGLGIEATGALPGDAGVIERPGGFDYASQMMYSSNANCSGAPECRNQCLGTTDVACPDAVCSPVVEGGDTQYIQVGAWYEGDELFGKPESFYDEPPRIPGVSIGGSYQDHDAYRWLYPHAFRRYFEFSSLNADARCLADPECLNSFATAQCIFGGGECIPTWRGAEDADQFGRSLALLPLGDENMSLAVGAPTETIDYALGTFAQGQVAVFDSRAWAATRSVYQVATHSPFQIVSDLDRFLLDRTYMPQTQEAFGASLAGPDLLGDGKVVLAIGKPGYNAGEGAVSLYSRFNSKNRYVPSGEAATVLVPSGAHTEFGAALASGDLNGDGRDELVVGSPGDLGRVFIYSADSSDALVQTERFVGLAFGGFDTRGGEAVAVADLDGDGDSELLIGAPNANGGAGLLQVRDCSGTATVGGFTCPVIFQVDGSALGPGARLGAAIAASPTLAIGPGGLSAGFAVGAPGYDDGRGIVLAFRATATGFVGPSPVLQSQTGEVIEPGDEFGTALALIPGKAGQAPILAVGAPGEGSFGVPEHGAVGLVALDFSGSGGGIVQNRGTLRSDAELPCFSVPSSPSANDDCQISLIELLNSGGRFGQTLAARGSTLAIGAPGWDGLTGRVFVGLRPETDEPPYTTNPNGSATDDSVLLMHWYSEDDHGPRKLAVRP